MNKRMLKELVREVIIESAGRNSIDIGDGFYIIGKTGLDVNGNFSIWVAKGSNCVKKIQTNGNVPAAHGKTALEVANDLVAVKQIKDYYNKYLVKEWGLAVEAVKWSGRLRDQYRDFVEFEQYDKIYGLARRLGFKTVKSAWEVNPKTTGSVNILDYRRISEVGDVVSSAVSVIDPKKAAEELDIKKLDIEDLERLIANPDPRMVKMYVNNKIGYVDMLKNKLAKLKSVGSLDEININESTPPGFPVKFAAKLLKRYKHSPSKAYATMWKLHKKFGNKLEEMWSGFVSK